jgi:hypothetical protein
VSAVKRCVLPEQAAFVIGVAGLTAEPTWRPGVEACLDQVNNVEGGILGRDLRFVWTSADILPGGVSQLANFQTLSDTVDTLPAPPGPKAVDALFGFLGPLSPEVAAQASSKNLLLFGASDGTDALRSAEYPNLYFWRPSLKEEMAAVVAMILPSPSDPGFVEVGDPQDVYITKWSGFFPAAVSAFASAWNERAGTLYMLDAKLVVDVTAENPGFFHVEKNDTAPPPNSDYGTFVATQYAAEISSGLDPMARAFLQNNKRKRSIVILDGPAGASGFLASLQSFLRENDPTGEVRQDLSIYIYSNSVGLMPPVLKTVADSQMPSPTTPVELVGDVLKLTRATSVVPDPNGNTALAQGYRSRVAAGSQSLLAFESYASCLYFSDVLRQSVTSYGNVETSSLLGVLGGSFVSERDGSRKAIEGGSRSFGPPTVYVHTFPEGDLNNPAQTQRWENGSFVVEPTP